MKIYVATPVNGRKEKTLIEKQEAARRRVQELRREIRKHLPDADVKSVFSLIKVGYGCEQDKEAVILGKCVRLVMECDVILMDDGWGDSHGCKVERYTAQEYGKEIWTLLDLEALKGNYKLL